MAQARGSAAAPPPVTHQHQHQLQHQRDQQAAQYHSADFDWHELRQQAELYLDQRASGLIHGAFCFKPSASPRGDDDHPEGKVISQARTTNLAAHPKSRRRKPHSGSNSSPCPDPSSSLPFPSPSPSPVPSTLPSLSPSLPSHSPNSWEAFHGRHCTARFFRQRRYLLHAFPELLSLDSQPGGAHVLELGCGSGSTVAPLLVALPNTTIAACDCSLTALHLTRQTVTSAVIVAADAAVADDDDDDGDATIVPALSGATADPGDASGAPGPATDAAEGFGPSTRHDPHAGSCSSFPSRLRTFLCDLATEDVTRCLTAQCGMSIKPGNNDEGNVNANASAPLPWPQAPVAVSSAEGQTPPSHQSCEASGRNLMEPTRSLPREPDGASALAASEECQQPDENCSGDARGRRGPSGCDQCRVEESQVLADDRRSRLSCLCPAPPPAGEGGNRTAPIVHVEAPADARFAGFDAALLLFTLSALKPRDMPFALRSVRRALKDGGLLLFRDYGLYDMAMMRFLDDDLGCGRNRMKATGRAAGCGRGYGGRMSNGPDREEEQLCGVASHPILSEREVLPATQSCQGGVTDNSRRPAAGVDRGSNCAHSSYSKELHGGGKGEVPALFQRGDGTLAYFFSKEYTEKLFSSCGFQCLELEYCCVRAENRRKGLAMWRVWINGKFQKDPL